MKTASASLYARAWSVVKTACRRQGYYASVHPGLLHKSAKYLDSSARFAFIQIDADDLMPDLGKANPGYKANISGSDYRKLHVFTSDSLY
jgi:hypothetical protein